MPSKKIRRRSAIGAATLVAALALSACAQSGSSHQTGERPSTLIIDQAFTAQSIDPATLFQVTDSITATGIYETLLNYDGDDPTPQPLLAESIEANDDASSYTITLREGTNFASGKEVTADDVVFSLNRLKNLNSNPAHLMEGISVEKLDDRTVSITGESPIPYLPHLLTSTPFSIVDSEVVLDAGGSAEEDADATDSAGNLFTQSGNESGSGPYLLEKYDTQSEIALVKNENYWGEDPAFERIVIRNVSSPQQQRSNLEAGESQIALDIPGRIAEPLDGGNLQVQASPSPEVLYLGLSQDPSSPTSNPDVLEAIKIGIDYEELRSLVGAGAAPATGIIPSKLLGALPGENAYTFNREKAQSLIEKAGMTGETITFDYANDYTRLAGIDYGVIAQGVQSQLEEIGLKIELNPTPTSTSLQRYIDGDTEISLWSWPPDYADPDNLLVFAPGSLIGDRVHWSAEDAPEIAELTEAARVAPEETREDAYSAWNKALVNDGPYIYLLEPTFFVVASQSIEKVSHDPMANLNLAQIR